MIEEKKVDIDKLLELALKNDVRALFALGYEYLRGQRTEVNFQKAIVLFDKAASLKYSPAYFALAFMYGKGMGVPRDTDVAGGWFHMANTNGIMEARDFVSVKNLTLLSSEDHLAFLLRYAVRACISIWKRLNVVPIPKKYPLSFKRDEQSSFYLITPLPNVDKDKEKDHLALFLEEKRTLENLEPSDIKKLAEEDYQERQNDLGIIYCLSKPPDIENSIYWFQKAAKAGINAARFNLSQLYAMRGEEKDLKDSLRYLKKASDNGLIEAQLIMADRLLHHGDGLNPDETALKLIRQAASSGQSDAMYALALFHLSDSYPALGCPLKNAAEGLKTLLTLADRAYPKALYLLGTFHLFGNFFPQNEELGLKLITEASDKKEPEAQRLLASLFLRGKAAEKDPAKAIEIYTEAASMGDAKSRNLLGEIYLKGEEVPKDLHLAIDFFSKALAQGDADAMRNLCLIYSQGIELPRDYELSVKYGVLGARKGDEVCLEVISSLFQNFNFIPGDYDLAVDHLTILGEKGDSKAQYILANSYLHGMFAPKDVDLALKWAKLSANQGFPAANCLLARFYENGKDVPPNLIKAEGYYRIAVLRDDPDALFRLGAHLAYKVKSLNGPAESFKFLKNSAIQGDIRATLLLAISFMDGFGVELDKKKAVNYFTKAAILGQKFAQYFLYLIYDQGEGVAKSPKKALKWLALSAEQFYPPALTALAKHYFKNGDASERDINRAYELCAIAAKKEYPEAVELIELISDRRLDVKYR
jgi:TPR repeat protein